MAELNLTKKNFDEEVLKSDIPVLVDFWASWCGPCKMLAPVVAQLADEYEGKVKVCKVNVDDEPDLRSLLRILLQSKGYQVEEAASGEENPSADL